MGPPQGLKTAIVEGDVVGGTCVNRGCVPSKALLAVSGRMRELRDEHHLKALGIQVLKSLFTTFLVWKPTKSLKTNSIDHTIKTEPKARIGT